MKIQRLVIVAIAALAVVATGCKKQLDSLSTRVEVLEGKVSSLEEAVSALKNAVDSKYAVDKVENTANGVNIFFTNGKTIEILNGKDGKDGKDGEDGDTLIKSITDTEDSVIIVLNDGKDTTFVLAKALRIVIGNPSEDPSQERFICAETTGDNKIELEIPAWESIASVKASLSYANGISNAIVTKAAEPAEPWTVKLAPDCTYAIVTIPESAKAGQVALLEIIVVKTDGSAVSSSKAIVYKITANQLYEEFAYELEQQQKFWTMVYNSTVMNEEYNEKYAENETYQALVEEVATLLSGIQQTIDTKAAWAEESYNNGTLAEDYDEILSTFEDDIQKPLTWALNLYNDGVAPLEVESAFEEFAAMYGSLQEQWTMVYNATVNNEEYEDEAYNEAKDDAAVALSAIQQNLDTKMTWATESYEAGTLLEDFEEIMSSCEEIQIQLTQALNAFNAAVAEVQGNKAFEEFQAKYEDIQKSWTMINNLTVNNEEYEDEIYNEAKENMAVALSAISQNLEAKMTWATESFEAGTLAEDFEEIMSSLEEIEIQLTQALNSFNAAVAAVQNDLAYEAFAAEYESLSTQWSQVYRTTVANEDYEDAKYAQVIEEYTAIINGISQNMRELQTWADESYEAGTLAEDLNEILASFEQIQTQLTQFLNSFNEAIAAVDAE